MSSSPPVALSVREHLDLAAFNGAKADAVSRRRGDRGSVTA